MHLAILPPDSNAIDMMRIPLKEMKVQGKEIEKEKPNFEDRINDLSVLIAQYMANFQNYIDLYNINAKYIILLFMDPECSHCRKETPELYDIYTNYLKDKDVVVLNIYLERNTDNWEHFCNNIDKWFSFIQKHKFYSPGWYNVWNPFANTRFKYDISSTPKVFLLDKDKKIIAKNIGPEQLKEIILNLEENSKEKDNK